MIKTHLPCPDCGSSDGLTEYNDGTFCFSCRATHRGSDTSNNLLTNIEDRGILKYNSTLGKRPKDTLLTQGLSFNYDINLSMEPKVIMDNYRNINSKTLLFFKVQFKDRYLLYPYRNGDGFKVRNLDKKEFFTQGDMKTPGLFGKELFPNGGKAITITEGENDAMSCYQMNGGYPSVSVRSSSHAKADCQADFEYLNSYDKIYLAFDNDEPGQKALKEVAALFNPNKVYHVKFSKHKDANAYLENNDVVLFNKEWWAAKPYLPSGIIGDYGSIEEILSQESSLPVATYPYKKLQDMTYGIRLGEINLFTAQEKIGKTEFMRSIEHHLLKTTDYNIGIIHLEEPEKRTIQGLVGYELKVPVHLPDTNVSNIEALKVYKDITKKDNRCFLYKHFGADDPNVILDTIRYLVAACDCKFIFLDHITMLVTGFQGDDERKTLDYLSTQLAMMTRELNFTLFLVSHVNDDGKTRGSRNISKVADLIVQLDRDIEAHNIDERNTTHLMVKGNRWAGVSGPSSDLWFDNGTFTYTEITVDNETPEAEAPIPYEGSHSRPTSLWAEAPPTGSDRAA